MLVFSLIASYLFPLSLGFSLILAAMELASRSSASNGAADLERIFLSVDVVLAAAKAVLWLFLAVKSLLYAIFL